MLYGRYSLTLTTLASVKNVTFNLCLTYLQYTNLYQNDISPPVCIFRSGCTPYSLSTHVYSWIRLPVPLTLLSLIVCFKICSARFNFALSSTVILVTLVQRNDISGSMEFLFLFSTHSIFATI